VNYAKTYFTSAIPDMWLYALGTLFILVTIFMPRGIVGLVPDSASTNKRQRMQADQTEPSSK
jgi:urea transport system permease protein